MAGASRVVLLTPDLMFGSKVEAMIRGAGAEAHLTASPDDALAAAAAADLLIVDLATDAFDGTTLKTPAATPVAGFYAHTDDDVRRRALAAGFALVAPRSRWMREGPALIGNLLGDRRL